SACVNPGEFESLCLIEHTLPTRAKPIKEALPSRLDFTRIGFALIAAKDFQCCRRPHRSAARQDRERVHEVADELFALVVELLAEDSLAASLKHLPKELDAVCEHLAHPLDER